MPDQKPSIGIKDLRPESKVSTSLAQLLALLIAAGGVGFSVGVVYPRIGAVELAVESLQQAQQQTAITLERVTTVLDRLEKKVP
jgi:hypothetical protein